MIKVGITGTGSLVGQGIIKSIINSRYSDEYFLVGFDYFDDTVGSFWCDKSLILPDILKKKVTESEWLDKLTSHINNENLSILFIGVDFELPILSRAKKIIEENTGCKVVVSSESVIRISDDKYLTYKFLKENNLNSPNTFLKDELSNKKLHFPLIVKPRIGASSINVFKVDSINDLNTKIKKINNPIIQEYIGDSTKEYTCGTIMLNGELMESIVLKRTLKKGNTHIAEHYLPAPSNISNYIKKVSNKLQPYGVTNFQLRVDDNNNPRIFEINARHSGTTYMRSLFGYNEVIFILKYILEGKIIKFDINEGKVMRFFDEKIIS